MLTFPTPKHSDPIGGFATSRTVVQKSAGHIDVLSEISKGTTFKIYLPRVEQPFDVGTKPSHPVDAPLPKRSRFTE
jgi:hypothetical protein